MFVVNDKGSSWAYASPSFGASLQPSHLRQMRELAGLPNTPKHVTEVGKGARESLAAGAGKGRGLAGAQGYWGAAGVNCHGPRNRQPCSVCTIERRSWPTPSWTRQIACWTTGMCSSPWAATTTQYT